MHTALLLTFATAGQAARMAEIQNPYSQQEIYSQYDEYDYDRYYADFPDLNDSHHQPVVHHQDHKEVFYEGDDPYVVHHAPHILNAP